MIPIATYIQGSLDLISFSLVPGPIPSFQYCTWKVGGPGMQSHMQQVIMIKNDIAQREGKVCQLKLNKLGHFDTLHAFLLTENVTSEPLKDCVAFIW